MPKPRRKRPSKGMRKHNRRVKAQQRSERSSVSKAKVLKLWVCQKTTTWHACGHRNLMGAGKCCKCGARRPEKLVVIERRAA